MSTANTPAEADYVGQIENFSDPVNPPAPQPIVEPPAVNPADDDEPEAKPRFFADEKRNAFYARRRAMAEGRAETDAPANVDPAAPFAKQEGEDDTDDSLDEIVRQAREANGERTASVPGQAPAEPGPAAAPKTYELKVNRNTFTATREQLLEMAGLTDDEAAGMPESVLVRAAQTMEAARLRLAEVKGATSSEPADRQAQPPYPAEGNGQNANGPAQDGPESLSALSESELVRRIQYGDEEEAAAALRESNRRALREEAQAQRAGYVKTTVEQELANFERANPDLVANADAMEILTASAVADLRQTLVSLGANPQDVEKLSQENVITVYSQAIAAGKSLPPVGDILSKAEAKARRLMNLPKRGTTPAPGQAPAPQPQPSAVDRRLAAKAALPQTPQRANTREAAPPPPTREGSRMSTLDWMRQTRFQKPLGR